MARCTLRRTVRFTLPPCGERDAFESPRTNPYASWPTPRGIAAYGELDVEVTGEPDPRTGYLVNIAVIDQVVRTHALPWLHEQFLGQCAHHPAHSAQESAPQPVEPSRLLPGVAARIAPHLPVAPSLIVWRVTPRTSFAYRPTMPDFVEYAQSFEFAASHRLHCPELDEETNRRIFGKCNNPRGHGHNYRLDVAVSVPLAEPRAPDCALPALEEVVDRMVIQRFDHKHLNDDCPEFATLNPSVEHIAKVCHGLLEPAIAATGASLSRVTVWETEKTRCSYPA